MDIKIRAAGSKDVEEVLKLYMGLLKYYKENEPDLDVISIGVGRPKLKREIVRMVNGKRTRIFIALDGGRVIGCTAATIEKGWPMSGIKWRGYLGRAFVKENYRRRGISRMLLDTSIDWLRSRGMRMAYLNVHASNRASRQACLSYGFRDWFYMMKLDL